MLSRITPDAIERIEVIRGPQGAALYGADAISGVTNIVTRHDGRGVGEPRFRVRSNFGMSGTDYASSAAFGQDHSLGFRTGTQTRSAGFNLQFGTAGEYIPGAFARNASADGSLQLVGARTMLSGTARFSTQKSGSPLSPVVTDAVTQLSEFAPTRLSLQQYTVGMRASYQHSDRWLHSMVAGVDGYALDGVPDAASFILSPVDSALREASGTAIRTTLRLRSTAQLVNTRVTTASLALAVEHSALKEDGEAAVFGGDPVWSGANHQMGPGSGRRPSLLVAYETTPHVEESRVNSGVSAQLNTSFANKLHLTGGLRLDRQTSSTLPAGNALLPTAGASYVIDGPISLKFRAAYGKGIRWPQLVGRPDGFQSRTRAARAHCARARTAGRH